MDPIVHFEMPYDNAERVANFYRSAFDWQMQRLGEEMGGYVLAMTTESDDKGPTKPGAINGGFFPKAPDQPAKEPSVVISVDDIKASTKKVTDAGGRILGEPMEIPGIGQYVAFADPEGNRVGMLQPSREMR
jgi:predicted enzyme related to lactoylglutathione lyase